MARCLRTLGRLDEAAAELALLLETTPYAAHSLVELARVESARGNVDAASEALAKALDTWSEADPAYAPAADARALADSLGTS